MSISMSSFKVREYQCGSNLIGPQAGYRDIEARIKMTHVSNSCLCCSNYHVSILDVMFYMSNNASIQKINPV
jgi:hypothetical protein